MQVTGRAGEAAKLGPSRILRTLQGALVEAAR